MSLTLCKVCSLTKGVCKKGFVHVVAGAVRRTGECVESRNASQIAAAVIRLHKEDECVRAVRRMGECVWGGGGWGGTVCCTSPRCVHCAHPKNRQGVCHGLLLMGLLGEQVSGGTQCVAAVDSSVTAHTSHRMPHSVFVVHSFGRGLQEYLCALYCLRAGTMMTPTLCRSTLSGTRTL
jgi:hypothetical protein